MPSIINKNVKNALFHSGKKVGLIKALYVFSKWLQAAFEAMMKAVEAERAKIGANVIKTLFFVTQGHQNKLEGLSLQIFLVKFNNCK